METVPYILVYAIIRIWREDKTGKLINSCERGC
nr:MAG TPA: FeoB-associated Cys-rich membrane protein [Caudoviricetes sp.]